MRAYKTHQFSFNRLVSGMIVILLCVGSASAQKKSSPAPAAKPAATTATPGATTARPAATTATPSGRPAIGTAVRPGSPGTTGPAVRSSGITTSNPTRGTNSVNTTGRLERSGGITTSNPTRATNPVNTNGPLRTTGPARTTSPVNYPGEHGNPAANPRTFGGRPLPPGNRVVTNRDGSLVRMRPGNRPADVHIANRNLDIHHGLSGNRRIEMERADHTRIFADRRGGYIEHRYLYRGREFGHRTYYYYGRPYDRFYSPYRYRNVDLNIYRPVAYYRPAFYGWAYNPWPRPVYYVWTPAPAVVYYGAYYTPSPVYPTASLWLTDYMVSNSLASAYQASQDSNTPPPAMEANATAITPEVKEMISQEVQRQIALENSEAQSSVPNGANPVAPGVERDLTDNIPHVFVAGSEVDLVDSGGNECTITEGDALEMPKAPPTDAFEVELLVLSSKGAKECAGGATVQVAISDLQEMQNHMRGLID